MKGLFNISSPGVLGHNIKRRFGMTSSVYHGTRRDYNPEKIGISKSGLQGSGVYLAEDPLFADKYAMHRGGEGGRVHIGRINISNPVPNHIFKQEFRRMYGKEFNEQSLVNTLLLNEHLRSLGYTGLKRNNMHRIEDYRELTAHERLIEKRLDKHRWKLLTLSANAEGEATKSKVKNAVENLFRKINKELGAVEHVAFSPHDISWGVGSKDARMGSFLNYKLPNSTPVSALSHYQFTGRMPKIMGEVSHSMKDLNIANKLGGQGAIHAAELVGENSTFHKLGKIVTNLLEHSI